LRWFCGAPVPAAPYLYLGAFLCGYRVLYRMACVGRVFGWSFAITTPVRILLANFINSAATLSALTRFFTAKLKGRPLVWLKTEHAYPCQAALGRAALGRRSGAKIGEILVANGYLTQTLLNRALETKPGDLRLG